MYNIAYASIIVAGVYNIVLGAFHILFWKIPLFDWTHELNKISRVNSGVMQIMNLCLIVLFFFMAYVSFFHANELLSTRLGSTILIGFSIFWILRLIEQFIYFGIAGYLFPILFAIGSIAYIIPAVVSLLNN